MTTVPPDDHGKQFFPAHREDELAWRLNAVYVWMAQHEPFQRDVRDLDKQLSTVIAAETRRRNEAAWLFLNDPGEVARRSIAQFWSSPHFDDPVADYIARTLGDVSEWEQRRLEQCARRWYLARRLGV